jgi:hypothetical protein
MVCLYDYISIAFISVILYVFYFCASESSTITWFGTFASEKGAPRVMGIYVWAIIILSIIVIVCADQRKWRCPAPGCDFSCEREDEKSAQAHTAVHAKHKPVLK